MGCFGLIEKGENNAVEGIFSLCIHCLRGQIN